MKLRTVISLSLVSLIAVVLIQLGGMLYAFHAQMQEAEKLLNKCFWMSFTETVVLCHASTCSILFLSLGTKVPCLWNKSFLVKK